MFPKPLVKSIWAIMCDVRGHSHVSYNVRCKMHQTRLQVKRTSENKTRLKRETQGAFCVLNANAKSQTRKSMKINVICTVFAMRLCIYWYHYYCIYSGVVGRSRKRITVSGECCVYWWTQYIHIHTITVVSVAFLYSKTSICAMYHYAVFSHHMQ